jgi:hypothetical protein
MQNYIYRAKILTSELKKHARPGLGRAFFFAFLKNLNETLTLG